ncbi:MAG: ABC transporter permease subunit [Clostridiales bacterium]|nr:ABC transporter permease subunit [Clostridiales bacterium]MBQ2768980.1 ABC transporter permease subunit [Clostridia bacterium]
MEKKGKKILIGIGKGCLQIVASFFVLAAAWWIAYLSAGNDLLVPPLSVCLKRAVLLIGEAWFWAGFGATFLRVLIAFALAFVFGVVFAVVSYLLPWFRRFFSPIASILRSLPVLAVLLILLVAMGTENAPVAVAFLSLFPMLYTSTLTALLGVDSQLTEMSKVYNVPIWKRVAFLYLPQISPYLIREGGAALSFSLKLVVSAEVIANTYESLGGLMQEARVSYEMPNLFALVILTFLAALLLEGITALIAAAVERRVK